MSELVIPPENHPIWESILRGDRHVEFTYLATCLIVSRLQADFRNKKDQATMEAGIKELRNFFEKKKHFPFVQEDIKKLSEMS